MLKKLAFFLILFLININLVSAFTLTSDKSLLINLNENKVIFENNSNEITSIASLTKIMTTIVAIENITDYEKKIIMTDEMFYRLNEENLYQIGLTIGQVVTVRDLLYGTFIASGADATRGLVYSIAKDEKDFVELMNAKAKELGMSHTHFTNTIGADDDSHKSTLKDVSKLFKYALSNSIFEEVLRTESYTLSDGTLIIDSSLKTTGDFYNLDTSSIIGGKTGYTLDAERCFASVAYDKDNDIMYMFISTNAKTSPEHIKDAIKVYNHYFENYQYYKIATKNFEYKKIKTKYSKTKEIVLKIEEDVKMYYDTTFDIDLVKIEYEGLEEITPINKKDEKIGKLKIYYDNQLIEEKDVLLEASIKFSIIEFIKSHLLIFNITIIIIIIYLIINIKKRGN